MAKKSYRVPYSLNQSYADMTIALNSKDGSVGKILPMMVVGTYVISILACLVVVMRTYIGSRGSTFEVILFIALWSALTVVLAKYYGTRRMNMQRVVTLINYLPSRARHVYTRTTRSAVPFYHIVGIDKVEQDGLVLYNDNTYLIFIK